VIMTFEIEGEALPVKINVTSPIGEVEYN